MVITLIPERDVSSQMFVGRMYFALVSLVLTCSLTVSVRGSRGRVVCPLQIALSSLFTCINRAQDYIRNSYAGTRLYAYVPQEFMKWEESATQSGIADTVTELEFGTYVNPHGEC